MSGGDSTGGGGGSTGEVLDCSKLFERTVLNSPKAEILAKLEAGQVLKLILMQSDSKKSLVAVTSEGEVAGSITTASLSQIKKCIDQGYGYIALVESVAGGRCSVLLRPETFL
ncbi:hypothetical protein [Geobacter sp. SVR]|uniref:hypothetical protein n=1 Tax=Geobacter sp. SVR TaxID=2495594 RepID=UPI00143EFF8E|nr:hypothetical protein [Geobacter sp. SVR]BCS51772.1 hypothetical protein GSVR_00800 [Geobacter sp. SVR]GCF87041.1 hypothetical protein GSbR_36410 [Geobacter sp. SVR]